MKKDPITLTNVEIQKILPHRYPFLLVDKIVDFEEGKSITGIKNVTAMNLSLQVISLEILLCRAYLSQKHLHRWVL